MDEFIKELDPNLDLFWSIKIIGNEALFMQASNRKIFADCPYCGSESAGYIYVTQKSFSGSSNHGQKTKVVIETEIFCGQFQTRIHYFCRCVSIS